MSIFTCVNNVNLNCHRYRYRCCYNTSAHAVVMLLISYRRICCDATHVDMLLLPLLCYRHLCDAAIVATPPLLTILDATPTTTLPLLQYHRHQCFCHTTTE